MSKVGRNCCGGLLRIFKLRNSYLGEVSVCFRYIITGMLDRLCEMVSVLQSLLENYGSCESKGIIIYANCTKQKLLF